MLENLLTWFRKAVSYDIGVECFWTLRDGSRHSRVFYAPTYGEAMQQAQTYVNRLHERNPMVYMSIV